MHRLRFGKGQGLAHEASESLSQGVVPALNMRGLSRLFAAGRMLLVGQDFLISVPEVGKTMTAAKSFREALPESLTSGGTAITCDVGNDLSGLATQSNPDPVFIGFFLHK